MLQDNVGQYRRADQEADTGALDDDRCREISAIARKPAMACIIGARRARSFADAKQDAAGDQRRRPDEKAIGACAIDQIATRIISSHFDLMRLTKKRPTRTPETA